MIRAPQSSPGRHHARFELVHSNAGYFARFLSSNGREVWRTSESYTRKRAAMRAIDLLAAALDAPVEIRSVDERGAA